MARSTSFFWDKLKEVPNRRLRRWAEIRREHGALPLQEVLDMVELSDRQLESEAIGTGVVHCWGLEEWGLFGKVRPAGRAGMLGKHVRPYYRLAASLTPGQLQGALGPNGLAWSALSPAQQQAFARTDQSAVGATVSVRFAPSGWYVWTPGYNRGTSVERLRNLPIVMGPTLEQALAAARKVDPDAAASEFYRGAGLLVVAFTGANGMAWSFGQPPFMMRGAPAYPGSGAPVPTIAPRVPQ
jgi:hypothetical protein